MMKKTTPEINSRLEKEKNLWIATVRPNTKLHLVPVWFIWDKISFYICISGKSVKYENIVQNRAVSLSLEDGSTPVICEGIADVFERPWPEPVLLAFKRKYDWEIRTDKEYDALVRIHPIKWLSW